MKLLRLIPFILIPLILLLISSSWLFEWLWLRELGYDQVFRTLKTTQVTLFLVAFFIGAAYLVFNLRYLAGQIGFVSLAGTPLETMEIRFSQEKQQLWMKRFFTAIALFLAFVFALAFLIQWDNTLRFFWSQPFGEVDPIFGRDIGFYLFQLPLLNIVQGALSVLAMFTVIILGVVYVFTGLISFRPGEGFQARPSALMHFNLNAAFWLLTVAWGFFLARYELLFRTDGVVFGAGYVNINIELPALWISLILTAILAFMLIINRWISMKKVIPAAAVLVVLTLAVGRLILPAAIQQLRVEPNELELESTYIENNIEMTRLAYGLDNVREVDYPADDTLTFADIQNNQDIVENIRLWDPRLLLQTYRQMQEIRAYYSFHSVDIDRYEVDGRVQQMMLGARELSQRMPDRSNTWINRHLQYTHGYGLTMSPVTATTRQGEPLLHIRDIPPVTRPDLRVDNPAIYFGEFSHDYHIVNTGTPELHYPAGDENIYHHYSGNGGIPFSSWFHRLLFAWELKDMNILLSDYIHSESRLQIWRGVQDRISRITPFLELDEDPYLVLHDGQLYWIQDAYTTSSKFPYSERRGGINYIRNSVKIVVDAYEGSVDYYMVDEEDPVLQVYDRIFPDLFQPVEELPEGLQQHFRYPQNIFEAQLELFSRYHMTNPRVFYNNEDLWERPVEKYAGRNQLMEAYYILGKLPDEDEMDFMLISPFTPERRSNMIAWMAAKSDPDNYGDLVVYRLPKDRLIFGPAQIEARIDQDTEISRQISLWDQRGSRVIRGNLMVIPIENSFMYVEPVFLLADEGDIPQLQRVIVAIGDGISMQPTLEAAIYDLFDEEPGVAPLAAAPVAETQLLDPEVAPAAAEEFENFEEIQNLWQQLREAMQEGDWARYGELLDELDDLIGNE